MVPNSLMNEYLGKLYDYNKIAKSLNLSWSTTNSKMSLENLHGIIFNTESITNFLLTKGFLIGSYVVESQNKDSKQKYNFVNEISDLNGNQLFVLSSDKKEHDLLSYMVFSHLIKPFNNNCDVSLSMIYKRLPKFVKDPNYFTESPSIFFEIYQNLNKHESIVIEQYDLHNLSLTFDIVPIHKGDKSEKYKPVTISNIDYENEIETTVNDWFGEKVSLFELYDNIEKYLSVSTESVFSLPMFFYCDEEHIQKLPNDVVELPIGYDNVVDYYRIYLSEKTKLDDESRSVFSLLQNSIELYKRSKKLVCVLESNKKRDKLCSESEIQFNGLKEIIQDIEDFKNLEYLENL